MSSTLLIALFPVLAFAITDVVKYVVIARNGEAAWDKNKAIVEKVTTLAGLVYGVIIHVVYDINVETVWLSMGIGAAVGYSSGGVDKLLNRKKARTLFGTPAKK